MERSAVGGRGEVAEVDHIEALLDRWLALEPPPSLYGFLRIMQLRRFESYYGEVRRIVQVARGESDRTQEVARLGGRGRRALAVVRNAVVGIRAVARLRKQRRRLYAFEQLHDFADRVVLVQRRIACVAVARAREQHDRSDAPDVEHPRARGELGLAVPHVAAAAEALRSARSTVALQVASAFTAYANSKRQVELQQRESLPQAEEVFRVASVSYHAGEASYVEFLQALQGLNTARNAAVDALVDYNAALIRLERIVGSIQ